MPSPTGHAARLALAVMLFTFVMAPVAGAAAGRPTPPSTASWTAQPARSGSGTDGGRPYFYLEGPPGTVLQDRLSVTNSGTAPVTVRLRGADAYNAEDGGFAVRGGKGSTGTGAWLRTAVAQVTVPARTRADVPFSVTVPTGATPGDHPGAIVVRSGDRSVGVRIQLRVGGPTLAALTVEDVTVSGRTIHYTLVNRGNTALAPRIAVGADGVFGTLLRRKARTLPVELLPGQRVRLGEPWRDAPALDSVTVRLRVTAAGGAHSEATARAAFVPWAPVTGGALLLLAAVAAGAYAYRLRRSRGRPPDDGRSGQSLGDQRHSERRNLVKAGAES
ncbi:hypothetical protein [Streptomyces sp. Ncost-T10-10d]|uniref:COG1470 family protein n=1 Tax=Streptomyces sp. Ncost-T10-10d TaxID=1839774 RepID=UPI00081E1AF5|nr:hypothetical protein [Streptomyces sp. Ncost-T10-10d]SCF87383.1 hypothetical protein GA0115254_120752 [Streptomyces sp. Ncost-T10-10d]